MINMIASLAVALSPAPAIEAAEQDCTPRALNVYFAPGSADLTAPADAAIDGFVETLGACRPVALKIEALALDADQPLHRASLADARRAAVLAALHQAGLKPDQIETLGVEIGDTPANAALPPARSVRLEVSLSAPALG